MCEADLQAPRQRVDVDFIEFKVDVLNVERLRCEHQLDVLVFSFELHDALF
jgi:hypothetical protein